MGSDLGHDDEALLTNVTSSAWSKKEKELLRLLLSNRIGSILVGVMIECMVYSYAVLHNPPCNGQKLIALLMSDPHAISKQLYYCVIGTLYFMSLIQVYWVFSRVRRRIGNSFIKSRRKHIFVFVTVFSFMFACAAFVVLRGSFYVVAMTVLACCVFELLCIFLFSLLGKGMAIIKLVRISSIALPIALAWVSCDFEHPRYRHFE